MYALPQYIYVRLAASSVMFCHAYHLAWIYGRATLLCIKSAKINRTLSANSCRHNSLNDVSLNSTSRCGSIRWVDHQPDSASNLASICKSLTSRCVTRLSLQCRHAARSDVYCVAVAGVSLPYNLRHCGSLCHCQPVWNKVRQSWWVQYVSRLPVVK